MAGTSVPEDGSQGFVRELGLFDSVMMVTGSMIGSGIFIVSANIARQVGSAGWLLAAWIVSGLLVMAAALSFGELAAMMPRVGGQYVFLPASWTAADGVAVVIPRTDSLRLEFAPPTGSEPAGC